LEYLLFVFVLKKLFSPNSTWEGGTGGSSTAGLGGRHGPYRLDLGKFDVHQVREEDKIWTDKAAEARARQMAREGLERRLKEIGLGQDEFEAYLRYQKRTASEAELIRGLVQQMSSDKSSGWARLLQGGVLDGEISLFFLFQTKNAKLVWLKTRGWSTRWRETRACSSVSSRGKSQPRACLAGRCI
jgi:hypothetical protein